MPVMKDEERGKIINWERYSQVTDFSGLRWGRITPTDLDMFIEFGNKLFIFAELKCGNAPMPRGQALALERLIDVVNDAGIPALLIIAYHNVAKGEIDVAQCPVRRYRYKRQWYDVDDGQITIKELIDDIREAVL